MASRFRALRDHEVATCVDGATRVLDLAAHVDDEHVVLVAEVDRGAGDTEAGDERGGPSLDQQLDLAQQRLGKGGEQVDAERLGGRLSGPPHLIGQLLRGHRRGPEAAEPAGLRHGRHQTVIGDTAHARQHHRVLDAEHVGQTGAHRRESNAPTWASSGRIAPLSL